MSRLIHTFAWIAFVGCLLSSAHAAPDSSPIERLKIGAILTLSGNLASAGEDSRRGIEAALVVAGPDIPIEFIYADSRNEPTVAISEFRKLVNVDRVAAVHAHRSTIGMALNPVSLKGAIPLLGAVGHQNFASGNDFAFQLWPPADVEGRFVADEFGKRKFKRVAVLNTEDEWTSAVTAGFRERLKELGITLAFDESFLPAEQDFRSRLLKLKASSPDAIYINLLLPQIAPAIKQAQEMNIDGPYFSNFYLAKKDVTDALGFSALEGVRFFELDTDLPRLKAELKLDHPPPGLTVASYVATLLLAQAVKESPTLKNAAELYAALLRQKEVNTPDRNYQIENRYVKFPLVVKVVSGGQFLVDLGAK